MGFYEEEIFNWMAQFAYQPNIVYGAVLCMMLLSGFGVPVPEEITLLSMGLLAYMGANPHLYPPPYIGAPTVNRYEAAVIASIAVFLADFLVYGIGRVYGRKVVQHPKLSHIFSPTLMGKAESFMKKYGTLATGIFRFTPGVRFPGHMLCGIMKFPIWKFAVMDGLAVIISVPTQILLIAYYGEEILGLLRKFKMVVVLLIGILIITFLALRLRDRARERAALRGVPPV